jgi:O-antigen ligase
LVIYEALCYKRKEMTATNTASKLLAILQPLFLALLVVRSTTEAFSRFSIYIGPTTVNLSVVVVLLMDIIAFIYLGILWIEKKLVIDRIGGLLMTWVLSLAPWVYLSSLQFGVAGLTGVREWVRLLSLVLLYLVVSMIARRINYERVINACLLSLTVPLAITYYQIIFSLGQSSSVGIRAFGTTVHPNNLATFLVVMIALTIWKLGKRHPRKGLWIRRALWSGLLLLELPALIAPISSNGWLMFGVFLLGIAVFSQGRRLKILAISIGIAALVLFIFISSENINISKEIMQNLEDLGYQSSSTTGNSGSLEGRFRMWGKLIDVWRAHPIRGYGLDSTNFVNPVVGLGAHNDFLRYLVEGGVFGLLLFVLFQVAVGWQLFRLRQQKTDSHLHFLAAIGFGLFAAWVIGSIGDNLIGQTVFQVYFWSILATVSAATSTKSIPAEALQPEGTRGELGLRFTSWSSALAQRMPFVAQTNDLQLMLNLETDRKTKLPRCRRCQTPALTQTDILCRRCFSSMLAPGTFLSLVLLVFIFIGVIGFYLWNKGAGLETFFAGWLLLYALLVTLLRNQKPRYIYAISSFALVGLVSAQLLFGIPVRSFKFVSQLSMFALVAVAVYGLGATLRARHHRRSRSRLPVFYARHYLVPLGGFFAVAYTLSFLLQSSASFVYGRPFALVYILTGLLALFVEVSLVIWGITGERWKLTLRSLAISYGSVLVLIQLGVLVSAGVLWAVAKLLPAFSATERFAPLLLQRHLGLYTWITIGLMILIVAGYIVLRRRLPRS